MSNNIQLLNDQPIGERNNSKSSGLDFKDYADVLSRTALGTDGPFTIGIYGEWGTGKTSLLHLIEKEINDTPQNKESITTVWFNAWKYEKDDHPLIPLIATILVKLEKQKGKMNKSRKELINALRAVIYGFSAKSKIKLPGFAEIEASFIAKDMIDREAKLSRDILIDKSLYYQSFEMLNKIGNPDNKIIVFIDDLDRCFPNKIIKLLESIKLVLCQPNFIFFLGLAQTVVREYLEKMYKTRFGFTNFTGRSYLEKIVQLPFYIPPHNDRIIELSESFKSVVGFGDDLTNPTDEETYKELIKLIDQACGGNIRSSIGFVNNIRVNIEIAKKLPGQNDPDFIQIAVSRILRHRWSYIYKEIYDKSEVCKKIAEHLRNPGSSVNDEEISSLLKLIRARKNLLTTLSSKPGLQWLQNEDKRKKAIQLLNKRLYIHEEEHLTGDTGSHDIREIINGISVMFKDGEKGQTFNNAIYNPDKTATLANYNLFNENIKSIIDQNTE
nr:hypothetical protein [bacterium]